MIFKILTKNTTKLVSIVIYALFIIALSYATSSKAAKPPLPGIVPITDDYYTAFTSISALDTDDNFKTLKPKQADKENMPINIDLIAAMTGSKNHIWYENQQVFKIFIPRNDLGVSIAGTRISSDMGLTSWISFKPMGKYILALGDLVLHENQVNPVMDELLANGFKITGLHSQFLWDEPKVMFMHIEGQGNEKELGLALAKVFVKLKENYGKSESNRKIFLSKIKPSRSYLSNTTISTVDSIMGTKGITSPDNQIYKMIFGRSTKLHSESLGQAMGVRSWAAFTGSDNEATITGDLAVFESELQDVLKAMRAANIQITGVHQRMLGEKPRILYVHYWGTGSIDKLAQGLRSALDKIGYQENEKEEIKRIEQFNTQSSQNSQGNQGSQDIQDNQSSHGIQEIQGVQNTQSSL